MLTTVINKEKEAGEQYNLSVLQPIGPNQPEFPVSEKELLQKLKVCRNTLATLREGGTIPFIKIGRRVLYIPSKVIAALETNSTKQTA